MDRAIIGPEMGGTLIGMRSIVTGLLIGASGLAVIAAPSADHALAPVCALRRLPLPTPPASHAATGAMWRDTLVPLRTPVSEKVIAGLPEQAPAERLTWDRVYALALVHARSPSPSAAERSTPGSSPIRPGATGSPTSPGSARSSSPAAPRGAACIATLAQAYLALLGRIQAVNKARLYVAKFVGLQQLVLELAQGRGAGLSPFDVNLCADAQARARRRLAKEVAGFRDALDELRPALGLSPHAAVVPDRRDLAGFRDVFEAIEAWQKNPGRDPAELPRTIERLPDPGEAFVNGRPILRSIEQDPARLEEALRDAARQAIKIRSAADKPRAPGDSDVAIELKVRRRIRRLLEMRGEYADQKRQYALGVRMADEAFERLASTTNPVSGSSRSPMLHDVIDSMRHAWEATDRLVALWTSFRAERLALYHELGALPYHNWDVFYAALSAPVAGWPNRSRRPRPPARRRRGQCRRHRANGPRTGGTVNGAAGTTASSAVNITRTTRRIIRARSCN